MPQLLLKRRLIVCLLGMLVCLGSLPSVQAQGLDAQNMTPEQLLASAIGFVEKGDFIGGLPYFDEMVTRFGKDPQHARMMQLILFYRGRAYMQMAANGDQDAIQQAANIFSQYVDEHPNTDNYPYALSNLADCYRVMGKFLSAVPYLEELVDYQGIPNEMREETREKIVQAYYVEKAWLSDLGCINWFLRILKESINRETRGAAATAAMQAYIETNQVDEALKLLPHVTGDNPARYNIAFNVSLLKAGDSYVKQNLFVKASLLFNMTLTVPDIVAFFEQRVATFEKKLSRLEDSQVPEAEALRSEIHTDITNARNQLEAAKSVNDYTPELRVRIARTYVQTGRDWEGFWAYLKLIDDHPHHSLIELFTYSAFAQAKKIDKEEYVRELGERYLGNPSFTKYYAEVSLQLAEYYWKRKSYDRFFEIADRFFDNNANHPYSAQFVYYMGSAYLELQQAEQMYQRFDQMAKDYPASPGIDGMYFWGGLAGIFTDRAKEAFQKFDMIVKNYPASGYYKDAIYRSGIAAFAQDDYDTAKARFEMTIQESPGKGVRGEAEYFLGQIAAMAGTVEGLNKAFEHYGNVEQYTDVHQYVKDAYFKTGELQEVNEMYADMAETFRNYINKYAEVGNVTDATFRLGEAYEYLGQPNEMLREYLRAIERFGDDQSREGVDSIIEAYPSKYYEKKAIIQANIGFIEKLMEDEAFRRKISGWVYPLDPITKEPVYDFKDYDRGKLLNPETEMPLDNPKGFKPYRDKRFAFEYFMGKSGDELRFKPTLVDTAVKRKIQRDDEFAKQMLHDISGLRDLRAEWKDMEIDFPPETPEEIYLPMYEDAKAMQERTLMFRLMRALERMGKPVSDVYFFTTADFAYASPSLLTWMGKKALEVEDYSVAQQAWEKVIEEFPFTEAACNAYLHLADLYVEYYQDYERALTYYQTCQQLFPIAEQAKTAAIRQGDMYRKLQQWDNAKTVYEIITKTPSWRGPIHAEAAYKIALCEFEAGKLKEARSLFQRTYLVHAFHKEWASKSYVKDIECLIKLGLRDEAKKVLEEFLSKEDYSDTEAYREGRLLKNQL